MDNIINAVFLNSHTTKTCPRWKFDNGMILAVSGVELPEYVEIHIANTGDSTTTLCLMHNGEVEIPNVYFETGRDIVAYFYLHTGDSGYTTYQVTVPVKPRPRPNDGEPTKTQEEAIDAAIEALNTSAQEAAASAESAEASANAASDSATVASNAASSASESATQAQNIVDGAIDDINDAKTAAVQTVRTEGETQTANATEQADRAEASATAAASSASQAEASATNAGNSATAAAQSATASLNAKTAAEQAKAAAAQSATSAATSANNANTKAGEAAQSAASAASSVATATQKASEASASATAAAGSATNAGSAANAAAASATAAGNAQTAAETAQGKAEDAQEAAEAVLESIPEDYTELTEDVADLKSAVNDLADTQTKSVFNQTVSGRGVLDVTGLNIPAGTYNMHIDSIESSDTSGTKSVVVFYAASGSILSLALDRNIAIDREISLTANVAHILFYASGGWSDSQGKTFSFNNFKIYGDTELGERLETLENNVGATNAAVEAVVEDVAFIKQNILETAEEKWCDGVEAEWYTSSTFSGFSSSWDIPEDAYVKDIHIKVRSRDAANISQIKVRIESGSFVFEKTYDVNVGQETQELSLLIDKNIPAGTVWFGIAANKKATFMHANDEQNYSYRYWTNGDISDLTGLKDTGGVTRRLWIVADVYAVGGTEETGIKCAQTYDLVVGDTFQLFYKGIVDAVYPENCYVIPNCSKGSSFERFFQITPNTAETLPLSLSLYDNKHHKMDEKSISLVVHNKATSPQSVKNVLCVGDSLTVNGIWPAEMFRRLTGTGGNPVGDGLSNISFIGTMTKDGAGYEGYGGWKFANYNSASVDGNSKVITCSHDKTDDDQHSIYKDSNNCQWKIETIYSSSIKIIAVSTNYSNFPSTGTLTWVSGGVNHSNIVYTASQNAPGNPFWDSTASKVDFAKYAENLGVSSIDYVYVMLGWNDAATGEDAYKAQAQTFIDNVQASFPNAKIVLMGLEIPARDGLGVNYGASGVYSNFYDLMQYVHNLDAWYDDLVASNTNVYHINISGQFDTEHNMQTGTRTVNTRNTETETYQTNGVHPAESGYLQIADATYRSITGLL